MIERTVILSKGSVLSPPPVELEALLDVGEESLTEMARQHIIRVLRETNGVLSGMDGAASRLEIKRTTLREKGGAPIFPDHFARRLYFFRASRRRSWGRAITV